MLYHEHVIRSVGPIKSDRPNYMFMTVIRSEDYLHFKTSNWHYSLCNKRHELPENVLSLILINSVPKVASNCE